MSLNDLKITDEQAKAASVASLPTRPTSSAEYGGRGLTAQQMKEAYDKYPALVRKHFNDLISYLLGDAILGDMKYQSPDHAPFSPDDTTVKAFLDRLASFVDTVSGESGTLNEFVNAVSSGKVNAITINFNTDNDTLSLMLDGKAKETVIPLQNLKDEILSMVLTRNGGTIDGDLTITGNLNLSGAASQIDTEQLMVRDAVIIANADGEDVVELTGFVIHTGKNAGLAIAYDPRRTDLHELLFGEVFKNRAGKYQFNQTYAIVGKPAFDGEFPDGIAVFSSADGQLLPASWYLEDATVLGGTTFDAYWLNEVNTFIKTSETHTPTDVFVYADTVDFGSDYGILASGRGSIVYDNGVNLKIDNVGFEIPLVATAGGGLSMDASEDGTLVEVKLDEGWKDELDARFNALESSVNTAMNTYIDKITVEDTYAIRHTASNRNNIIDNSSTRISTIRGNISVIRSGNFTIPVGTSVMDELTVIRNTAATFDVSINGPGYTSVTVALTKEATLPQGEYYINFPYNGFDIEDSISATFLLKVDGEIKIQKDIYYTSNQHVSFSITKASANVQLFLSFKGQADLYDIPYPIISPKNDYIWKEPVDEIEESTCFSEIYAICSTKTPVVADLFSTAVSGTFDTFTGEETPEEGWMRCDEFIPVLADNYYELWSRNDSNLSSPNSRIVYYDDAYEPIEVRKVYGARGSFVSFYTNANASYMRVSFEEEGTLGGKIDGLVLKFGHYGGSWSNDAVRPPQILSKVVFNQGAVQLKRWDTMTFSYPSAPAQSYFCTVEYRTVEVNISVMQDYDKWSEEAIQTAITDSIITDMADETQYVIADGGQTLYYETNDEGKVRYKMYGYNGTYTVISASNGGVEYIASSSGDFAPIVRAMPTVTQDYYERVSLS